MLKHCALIGVGGFMGGIFRYLVITLFTHITPSSFPVGTFAVNILGCLLIGLFIGLSERVQWISPDIRFFLATGICGGFTTFSSFAYENFRLFQENHYIQGLMYVTGSCVIGILVVFLGFTLTKIL